MKEYGKKGGVQIMKGSGFEVRDIISHFLVIFWTSLPPSSSSFL
jgi:hypothetical protein